MPRFAANLTMMFAEIPFPERFAAAARAGFQAVECLFPYAFPPEEIAGWLETTGLELALINAPPGDWEGGERGLAVFPARQDEFCASLDLALGYARRLGVHRLHVMAGVAPANDAAACAVYRDNLLRAADMAGPFDIDILVEPLNPRDMPDYFLNDFDRAADLLTALDHPRIRLQFDIYHRQILHGDVIRGLESLMPMIGHVQIASVPDRHEPGSGELDDARILRKLDALGYDGFVGCEYRPVGDTAAGLGWMTPFQSSTA